jgi:hypothetical protein
MKECFVHIIICSDNRSECVYRQHHRHVCTNGRLDGLVWKEDEEKTTDKSAQSWNDWSSMGKSAQFRALK